MTSSDADRLMSRPKAYNVVGATARPADTTAYTAGDVVGGAITGVITLPGLGVGGNPVVIRQAMLIFPDLTGVPASMSTFRLYLFSQTPSSALADNAAWTMSAADMDLLIGYIDFTIPIDLGSALVVMISGLSLYVQSPTSTAYGYLVTAGGYTPASGSVATIKLFAAEL